MKKDIDDFLHNRHSGAAELAIQEIEIIQNMLKNGYSEKQIKDFLNQAQKQFPAMAPIIKIKQYFSEGHAFGRQEKRINPDNINSIRKILSDKSYIQHSRKIFAKNVSSLTFSNSSSVKEVFLHYKKMIKKLICCHSLPLGEGEALHRFLLENNINSQLIEDSEASLYIHCIDFVIIGADMITENYVVNKIGSLQLALLARHFSKPIYVICSKSKFIDERLVDFSCLDRYFEKFDRDLITEMIS